MPIHCQYYANPRSIFLWIFANPCQSMPILVNPMPISGQSVTSYVINHRTSPLYGMVPSLIGGWIKANSPVIDWQVISTGPNPFQSMPILTNPVPIRGHLLMPVSIHSKPIHSQSFIPAQSSQPAKQSQASQQRTTQSQQQFHDNLPSQSDANPSQSNVNFSPIRGHLSS